MMSVQNSTVADRFRTTFSLVGQTTNCIDRRLLFGAVVNEALSKVTRRDTAAVHLAKDLCTASAMKANKKESDRGQDQLRGIEPAGTL